MAEKGHKFSLTIISGKSFCGTTFFIFSVSFIAKLVVNKFEGLKLRKENIEKEHQVAQFYFAWGLFFHQVLLLCVYFKKKMITLVWSFTNVPNSSWLFRFLPFSLPLGRPSGTIHALITVGHVEKQVLFVVLLKHSRPDVRAKFNQEHTCETTPPHPPKKKKCDFF